MGHRRHVATVLRISSRRLDGCEFDDDIAPLLEDARIAAIRR